MSTTEVSSRSKLAAREVYEKAARRGGMMGRTRDRAAGRSLCFAMVGETCMAV